MRHYTSIGTFFLSAVLFFSVSFANGAAADSKAAQKAQADYMLHCAPCHGDQGDGKGQLAAALNPAPRDHTDSKYFSSKADDHLIKVVANGGSSVGLDEGMPPFNTILSPDEIKGVVAYVRQLCKCKYTK